MEFRYQRSSAIAAALILAASAAAAQTGERLGDGTLLDLNNDGLGVQMHVAYRF
jgi:hypothetical protein